MTILLAKKAGGAETFVLDSFKERRYYEIKVAKSFGQE
jgi:hypothetical protein